MQGRVLTSVGSSEGRGCHASRRSPVPQRPANHRRHPPAAGDVFRCPGERALRTSSSALGPETPARGRERGRRKQRRAPRSEGAEWAAAAGWTPDPRRGPVRRVARGQGWAAVRTEAAAAAAQRGPGPEGLSPGAAAPPARLGGDRAARLTDRRARRGSPATSPTARGRGGLSLLSRPLQPPEHLTFRTRIPPGRRLAGASGSSRGIRAGPRVPAPPPPSAASGGCTGTPGRRDAARSLSGARRAPSSPAPAAPLARP